MISIIRPFFTLLINAHRSYVYVKIQHALGIIYIYYHYKKIEL